MSWGADVEELDRILKSSGFRPLVTDVLLEAAVREAQGDEPVPVLQVDPETMRVVGVRMAEPGESP